MPSYFDEAMETLSEAIKSAERHSKDHTSADWGKWDDMAYRLRVIHHKLARHAQDRSKGRP